MGLAIVPAEYLTTEKFPPKPSLRVTVNRLMDSDEIDEAFEILEKASRAII
jgi:serine palmitoyltransferase